MNDKDYTILKAEKRDKWHGAYGDFQSYALQLEGVEGWVELSQKPETPAPQEGNAIHGHVESTQRGENTYLKFKKVNPQYNNGQPAQSATPSQIVGDAKTTEYIVEMLEELTGRRKKQDVAPEELDDTINLADIPF